MNLNTVRAICSFVTMAAASVLAPAADAVSLYVASNGLDSYVVNDVTTPCGARALPCRSISQAIDNAAPLDTIVVGPGLYGDLNGDGTRGDRGEERGGLVFPPGCTGPCFLVDCQCVLLVDKAVIVISSHGAAATLIEARNVSVSRNVLINAGGATFGRPGQGFTVTSTLSEATASTRRGIAIDTDSKTIAVRGNQVVDIPRVSTIRRGLYGIEVIGSGPVVIEGNQVMGWNVGIKSPEGGSGTAIKGNYATMNAQGIQSFTAGRILGNVLMNNGQGLEIGDAVSATGNAFIGNTFGVEITSPFHGAVSRNNFVGNLYCGLYNRDSPGVRAENNWWGASTGPVIPTDGGNDGSADPPDAVCNDSATSTTDVTPFATGAFAIDPIFRP